MSEGNGLAPDVAQRLRRAYGLDERASVGREGREAVAPREFRIVGDDQLENMPEPEWLIEGILPANGLAMLYGAPEAGKSFLALDMALAIASQPSWHGRALRSGGVVYVAAEGLQSLKRRVAAWKYVHDFEGCAGLFVVPEPVQLMDSEEAHGLLTTIDTRLAEKPVLILFDTLQRCMAGGDENDQGDAGKVVGNLDYLRKLTGATCGLIHHPGVQGGRPRGSTVFMGAMDAAWELREDDAMRILECKKLKDAPHFDPMRFALQPVQESCVLAEVSQSLTIVSGRLSPTQRKCLDTLAEIETLGGTSAGIWLDASGVAKQSFYRAVKRLVDADYVRHAKHGRYEMTAEGRAQSLKVSPGPKKVA